MSALSRRALVQGAVAVMLAPVAAVASPATATLGERQMRQKLIEQLSASLAKGSNIVFDPRTCRFVRIQSGAARELAEFDRGEGIWRALADRHPEGIPRNVCGEVRIRSMLEGAVWSTKQVAEEMPDSPEAVDAHRRAVASLEAFERGEGLWRYAVKAAPDEIW